VLVDSNEETQASHKKRPTATDASDEDAKAATLEHLSKKKKFKKANHTELGEARNWTEAET
jgi:hypothetical protein